MKHLYQKKIYIRPLAGTDSWEVVKQSPITAFFHDWFWYGFEVALGNLTVEWTSHES